MMEPNENDIFSEEGRPDTAQEAPASIPEPAPGDRLPNVPDSEPVIETGRPYSDAGYVSSAEAAAVPPRYHCAPPTPPKAKREKRRGMPAAAVVALCLVCAILGGLAGGWLPTLFTGDDDTIANSVAQNESGSGTVLNMAAPQPNSQVSTNFVSSGSKLSAAEIYSLACAQTVAVTTEVTYRSFYGYSTTPVSGSGFIISSNGYILTNYHVVEDAVEGGYEVTVLTYDGTEYTAAIVGYEKDNDVAVLKIEGEDLSAVTLGDSDSMVVGEDVYAVGNPLGELGYTMTKGMISALDREITSYDDSTKTYNTINMFQIDAAVNAGNSGGPVYNDRGEVIGIVTAKYSDTGVEGLGFAIPINDAVSLANDIITNGYVRGKASMGVTVQTVPSSAAQYYGWPTGAFVYAVERGSAAEEAGLQTGDIIVQIDDTSVSSSSDLITAKKNYRAGESAVLKVFRDGEYLDLTIVFDEAVPDSASAQSSQTQNGGYGYGIFDGGTGGYGGTSARNML